MLGDQNYKQRRAPSLRLNIALIWLEGKTQNKEIMLLFFFFFFSVILDN